MYDDTMAVVINGSVVSFESLGMKLQFGDETIKFYSAPGHSDASVVFTVGNSLFSGDALLKDLKTVTNLPTGSKEKQKDTLNVFRKMQGTGLVVYPGHGESFELDGYDLEIMV
jgi:glyoxylase-like metal-dependent hydrolase (beta-lactamase superfamily II)